MGRVVPWRPPCAVQIYTVTKRVLDERKRRLTLQEEIKVIYGGNSPINNSPRSRVSIPICRRFLSGIESSVMALSTDDDSQFGHIGSLCSVESLERSFHRRELLADDDLELTF